MKERVLQMTVEGSPRYRSGRGGGRGSYGRGFNRSNGYNNKNRNNNYYSKDSNKDNNNKMELKFQPHYAGNNSTATYSTVTVSYTHLTLPTICSV